MSGARRYLMVGGSQHGRWHVLHEGCRAQFIGQRGQREDYRVMDLLASANSPPIQVLALVGMAGDAVLLRLLASARIEDALVSRSLPPLRDGLLAEFYAVARQPAPERAYRCPVCATTNPDGWRRCERGDCTDGRDLR